MFVKPMKAKEVKANGAYLDKGKDFYLIDYVEPNSKALYRKQLSV